MSYLQPKGGLLLIVFCSATLVQCQKVWSAEDPSSFESFIKLTTTEPPINFEIQASVLCTSISERVHPIRQQLQELADSRLSLTDWSNKVVSIARQAIADNQQNARQVWHLRYSEAHNCKRIDTLEDIMGERPAGANFSNPTETRISWESNDGKSHTNYFITPKLKAMRISTDPKSFLMIVPRQYLLEIPPSINAMGLVVQSAPKEFTFETSAVGNQIVKSEMRATAGVPRVQPLIRGFKNESTSKWIGLFTIGEKGEIRSAAVSADALGLPLRASTIFFDYLNKDKMVVTAVEPGLFDIGTVQDSEFSVEFPTNWTIIDDHRGVATLDGKVVGKTVDVSHPDLNQLKVKRTVAASLLLGVSLTSVLVYWLSRKAKGRL